MGKKYIILAVLLIGTFAAAAIPVQQASTEKKERYLDSGVFVGGFDQGVLTLLNVRHSFQKNIERIVFDLGRDDKRSVERPGFFHIAIQKKPSRVIIDLQNVSKSKVSESQITQILRKAHFFSKAV